MIKIKVPASSANLGPGFDTLGLALQLYLELTAEESGQGIEMRFTGCGAGAVEQGSSENLVLKAMNRVFDRAGERPDSVKISVHNQIPLGKGLGSSAAAISGGIYLANRLLHHRFSQQELLRMAVEMEGHADNIVPAFYGGLTTAMIYDGEVYYQRLDPGKNLEVVVVIPDYVLPTAKSRSILPDRLLRADAISNMQQACFLMAALHNEDYRLLKAAMDDRIYQPLRKQFIPGFDDALTAAYSAGALGAALSGAGPSLLIFAAPESQKAVGATVQEELSLQGVKTEILHLKPDFFGIREMGN